MYIYNMSNRKQNKTKQKKAEMNLNSNETMGQV